MIIVTGASKGIGEAVSKRLIKRGERVIGLARTTSKTDIEFIKCDVSDYNSVKNAADKI